ncbi:phage holin family protein [Nocardioides dongxiaopingii]|uniref:phage holin family protein n=1 Tax=Nocardioides TaxID=1839 RepID=UPI0010C76A20|nr:MULTISPECIES: phage holin family protein [Nocardioides]QCW52162.1 phage holin family protein [Nocardioides sp. S-1144]
MRILLRLVTTALGVAAAAWFFDGIAFTGGPRQGWAEVEHNLVPLLLVAAILGIITSFVKPLLTFLSIPLIILTLGLFLLVINAAVLMLTGALADGLGIPFRVDGFWTAVGGAIVITLVTWVVDGAFGASDDGR